MRVKHEHGSPTISSPNPVEDTPPSLTARVKQEHERPKTSSPNPLKCDAPPCQDNLMPECSHYVPPKYQGRSCQLRGHYKTDWPKESERLRKLMYIFGIENSWKIGRGHLCSEYVAQYSDQLENILSEELLDKIRCKYDALAASYKGNQTLPAEFDFSVQ